MVGANAFTVNYNGWFTTVGQVDIKKDLGGGTWTGCHGWYSRGQLTVDRDVAEDGVYRVAAKYTFVLRAAN